ncbi:Retinoic acid induced 16-like protein-domain-containing protein [Diplogelasinospora grovesii]|uniref:Retinoic acid induced 16-like protein-domain-containing protein n=1 Tax=Diplogelasinospora grovesii TaxID=303347 RepID=A0AAN6N120_9PEZI|nr:Retinoic acid induced 16-like protein-domain-containing protein [Diplogelasinospora grovesii]
MDFWSRLLAHTPLSSGSSRKDFAKDPARRLHRFEKEYSQLLQTWRNSSNLAHDDEAAEYIEIRLQELTNLLSDESRRPLPHPCITFAATKQVYIPVAKIATTSYNEWIIKEAVLFFATLIESEEEAFVENDNFSASLTNLLVRITGANSIRLGADTEARVVELAFNITTKIRLDPEILPAWFKTRQSEGTPEEKQQLDEREKFTGRTQKQDFPLFYLLIDYIHHEGKVGDFARTGLLYIIEAASSSVALEQWIVESDLSTLMATGLGALYSQLSRKLVIDHPANDLPPILAFSDYQHPKSNYEVMSSCSFEFQSHLDTFLSHLLFWQDVLNHCRSVEVKSTLLEHFQVIFLQQLLYPSLLESSDIDGGSSVAVLTYLRRILETVDHPDMINLILHYLLALPDIVPSIPSGTQDVVSAARKRKSMDLATMMASKGEAAAEPLLFNLVDLILACLRSHSQQTIYVTLQLVSVILKRHHRYAVITLLYTEGVHGESSHRTSGAHQQEVEYLMSLAGIIGGQDNFDEIYDNVVKDTLIRLENHPCSIKLVTPKTSTNNHKLPAIPDSLPGAPRDVRSHTLRPDDPLLNIVLDRLETFFLNPVETNLSLTEAIFDLAVCGFMHLEGWFLRSVQSYAFDDEGDEPPLPEPPLDPDSTEYVEFKQMQSMQECRRRPKWIQSRLPRFLAILQTLCGQVAAYRETIPRFDDLLQQRREAFQIADTATPNPTPVAPGRTKNAASQQPPPPIFSTPTAVDRTSAAAAASENGSRNASRERPSGLEGFAQRILSELGTPSRSASPRGRKEANKSDRSTPALAPVAPALLPPYETPARLLRRSDSPAGSVSSITGAEAALANQMKAFQAVDQSILARRVGIPNITNSKKRQEVEAIPLSFDRDKNSRNQENISNDVQEDESVNNLAPSSDEEEDTTTGGDGVSTPTADEAGEEELKTVSVSHLLTNVIVLQSFLFELASLVQVRAGLFDEVRFA